MPRRVRVVIPGLAHHIIQRGNNRQSVFEKDADYLQYCYWLTKYATMHEVEVVAYCLMTNHVHFIMIPKDEEGIGRALNTVQMRYAQYMNKERKTSGHLWQGRYYSCALDDAHLYRAIRYVEQNPVRARMVKEAGMYSWSSARWHLGFDRKSKIFLKEATIMDKKEWRGYLKGADGEFDEEIRLKTQKGLVIGCSEFISGLEKRFGRILRELRPGRPTNQRK